MGRGSSKIGGGGGAPGGGAVQQPTPTATARDNSDFRYAVRNAINNSGVNINTANPEIRKAMNSAPIGTELEIDRYYSNAGQLQDVFKKVDSNTWEHTWRVRNGEIFWTEQATASDIFNAMSDAMGLL